MDPFAVLGVERSMDLATEELDQRYLELSRQTHPDHQRAATPQEQIAVLERSAQLNDAYRILSDPWKRARSLLELHDHGVIERTKELAPMFLADALELAEEVEQATGAEATALAQRLEAAVAEDLAAISGGIAAGDFEGAATRLHQSRYHRKALEDLTEQE